MRKPPPETVDLSPLHRRIEKPWGWEIIWAETPHYTGKLLHVHAGARLSLQYHDGKTETQCLLSGRAILAMEAADGSLQEIAMETGKGYTLQAYQAHRLTAIEDTDLMEVSTPERGVTVRLDDDYSRGDETEDIRGLPGRGWSPNGAA